MEKGVISHLKGSHFCKSIVFLICYIFLVQSCIWMMPPPSIRHYPADPISPVEKRQGILPDVADAFRRAIDLFLPDKAYADLPIADAGGPYIINEEAAQGGLWTVRFDGSNSSSTEGIVRYEWDFGDGDTLSTVGGKETVNFFASGMHLYGYDVADADLRIIASQDNTMVRIINLQSAQEINSTILNKYEQWENVGPGDGIYFKIEADKPVIAYETDMSWAHSAFVPSLEGGPVGREFIFFYFAGEGFYVFAIEDTMLRMYQTDGTLISEQSIAAGSYWNPGLSNGIYHFISSGKISMQTVGGNAYTTVPSISGSGVGRKFYCATSGWLTGALAIFAYEDAQVRVYDLNSGNLLWTEDISKGSYSWKTGVGTRRLRIESTGDIEVWAGDTEQGQVISSLGDDISFAVGRDAKEFYVHGLMDGLVIFAPFDNTILSLDGQVKTLSADGYLHVAGGAFHHITSNNPILIQTLGRANSYNDLGTYLGGVSEIVHQYIAPGSYTITLTVYDSAGQSATDTTSVQSTVGAPPIADPGGPYIFDEAFVTEGKWTVVVNGIGSTDDYGICTYQWDFGDGGSGTGISPTHQYSATGTYTLTLMVTDYAGQTHTSTTTVTILDNDDPVPSITAPETVGEENASLGCWSVDFDASGSTDDFGILRYEWDFGDGSTGTGQSITHSYCTAGTYTVTLTVYDHAGQSGSATTTIQVQPGGLPVADAGGPYGPIESGQLVTFDGTGSTDDFGITEYFWDFGEFIHTFNGTQINYAQWAAPPQVIQDNEIILTGADSWGTRYFFSRHPCHRDSVLEAVIKTPTTSPQLFMIGFKSDNPIYHYNQMPYAVYFFGGYIFIWEDDRNRWQRSGYTYGQEYEVRIELKKDTGALYYFRKRGAPDWNLIYDSNYGNLKSLRIGADAHSGSFAIDDIKLINHAYGPTPTVPIFQDQTVTLTVTDSAGQTDSDIPDVDVVIGAPPQAEIVAPDHLDLGIEGTFDASSSTDDYGIAAYLWDFGDGSSAEGRIVYHFYSSVGTYTVILKVYDNAGHFDIATKTIEVSGENLVVCVPWQIVGGVEIPHDTWSGNESVLKAVAKSAAVPIEYTWDFGDGTSESGTITNASGRFAIEARHIYTGSAGEPFVATITITDDTGITASDTYRLIIRPKTLEIEENVAIDNGLWWLYKNQIRDTWPSGTYRDAPVEYSYWRSYELYSASSTASVVQAFLINGHMETGDPIEDPYVETVRRGMRYVFTTLNHVNIGPQTYGNPDTNGNGIGLQVDSFRPIYEGGMVMDAIAATGTPDAIARTGRANVCGRTYLDIMIDMVDMYAWGQNDGGGWRYSWNVDSDNSAAQWGAIGLLAAEEIFGIEIPQWVKERNDVWLNYSYDGIGFGYTYRGHGVGQTPAGMIQLAFCDKTTSDSRWQTSEDWIANNWAWWLNQNNIYACYAFAKAMRTAQPQEVVILSATGSDWFNDEHQGLARYLMDLQETDLGWPNLYFSERYYIGRTFSTAWSIIILTRTLFVKPPVALIHASPNPGAIGQEIRFDASASYHLDPFRRITGYQWDFDVSDGLDWEHPDVTGRITTHTYGELKDYTVTLRVLDNNVPVRMDTDIVVISITIPPHPPTANADGPYIAATGESITLDGSGSYDIDESEGDSITAYGWEIDMIAPRDFDDATGISPTVSGYDMAGTYPIGLRVADNTENVFPSSGSPNLTDDDFTEVIVYNRCITDLYIRPKGTKASLVWTHIGADEYKVYRSEKGPNTGMELIGTTNSTYSTFIDYNVELNKDYWYRVQVENDIQICVSNAYHIKSQDRIRNRPPKITSTPILTAQETQLYVYDVEANDPDRHAITYILDQAPDGMSIDKTTGLIEWTPAFSQIGPNNVTIRAMDALRASSTQFFIIVVSPRPNEPPVANPGGPYSSLKDQGITFDGSGSYDPEGDLPLTYEWNFGDGITSTEKNPTHVYTASGLYIVTLFVTDSRGATGSAETTAQIDEPNRLPIADIGGPYTGHAQTEISFDGSGSYDPDGDPLTYTWDFGDSTPPVTGITVMHIYEIEGTYNVSLTVDDDRGGVDTDETTVAISPPNQPPNAIFTVQGELFTTLTLTFDATSSQDPEGQPISSWMWDFGDGSSTTGAIVTHVYSNVGEYTVVLTVTDNKGAEGKLSKVLSIDSHIITVPDVVGMIQSDAESNITSSRLSVGTITQDYSLSIPAGSVISQNPPAGSSVLIHSTVNLVVSLGPKMVTVPNVKGMSQSAAESNITSAELTVGSLTQAYSDTVPVGIVISQNPAAGSSVVIYSPVDLVVSLGMQMVIVPDVVGMSQSAAENAINSSILTVGIVTEQYIDTVPQGNVISQSPAPGTSVVHHSPVDLVVSIGVWTGPDDKPPVVTVSANPDRVYIGETVTITVQASDNAGVAGITLTVNGDPVPLVGNQAVYTAITTGYNTAQAAATDKSDNIGTGSTTFVVMDPSDTEPPVVSITSPVDSEEITLPKNVIGTADDSNLEFYTLEIAKKDTNEWTVIATGTSPVINGVLGQFDPTLLINSLYDIRLAATDFGGNTASTTVTCLVTGNLKVGINQIAFTDLQVPVSGIDITIQRKYDNCIKTKNDFGVGWSINILDLDLRENRAPGEGWSPINTGDFLPYWELRPTKVHMVIVTYPDGKTDLFDAEAYFEDPLYRTGQSAYVSFAPRSGTTSTLQPLGSSWVIYQGGNLLDVNTFQPYNPNRYLLTTKDGTEMVINQQTGLESIEDLNGNAIYINENGILHSSGKSIFFIRDAQDRITQIIDPMNNAINYAYDSNGDLVSFTDRESNTVTYTYDDKHNLIEYNDPRGVTTLRCEYDESGRLIATRDANGNRIELSHDPDTYTSVVRDRLGNATVFEYNERGDVLRQVDALGNVTTYTYDERGNQLTETDPLGNTTTYMYDTHDNLLTKTDPLGNTTTYTYNARGQVLSTTDPLGYTTTNIYYANGNLWTNTNALGETSSYTYDARGNLLSSTDFMGNTTTHRYDAYGNSTKTTGPDGSIKTYTYNANGNQLTESITRTTPSGQETITTRYIYDKLGRLVRTINPYDNSTITEYDSIGKKVATIDELGRRTQFEYNSLGQLVKTIYPDGTFDETSTYDAEGRLLISIDRGGRITSYSYDALGRLIQITSPDGSTTRTTYDSVGRIATTTDERGNETRYSYDAAGRRTAIEDPSGTVTTFTYDKNNNELTKTDVNGNTTSYQYNANNWREKTIFADASTTVISYDALGNRIAETDQADITTRFEYNASGQIIKVINALENETSYTYDEMGNQLTQTDANGNTTTFEYDKLGRLIKRTLPLGMSEVMTYDANGNLITSTDFNGDTIVYSYDVSNRRTNKTYPDGTQVSFTYTATGQRATVTDGRGITSYNYDLRDRLIQIVNPDGTVISYTYDPSGNRTSVSVPSGTTTYTYDKLNRLETVNHPDGSVTTNTYDAIGNRTSVTYPNGTVTEYTYNALNRLIYLENRKSTGEIILSNTYTLGPAGNRIREEENTGRVVNYTYDDLYRLTKEDITDPILGNEVISYTYDAVGNRLIKTDSTGTTTYTYNSNDQLLSEVTPTHANTYTYDGNGNTVTISGDTTTNYYYDYENRLIGAQVATSQTAYQYDADGMRVKSTTDGKVINYLADKNREFEQVLEETDTNGSLIVSYVYGDDLISQNRSGSTSYYHYDGLGSVRALTNDIEAVTDTYNYKAFGELIAKTGATQNKYLFTGEQYDENVEFYYLRSRYFNPVIGRFLTMDSFPGVSQDPKSLHKYVYVGNDPINNIDPSGEFVGGGISIAMVIVCIMGILAGCSSIPLSVARSCVPPEGILKMPVAVEWVGRTQTRHGTWVGWTRNEVGNIVKMASKVMSDEDVLEIELVPTFAERSISPRDPRAIVRDPVRIFRPMRFGTARIYFIIQLTSHFGGGAALGGDVAALDFGSYQAGFVDLALAHELGHTLGLGEDNSFPNLMRQKIKGILSGPTKFLTDIQRKNARRMGYCLLGRLRL